MGVQRRVCACDAAGGANGEVNGADMKRLSWILLAVAAWALPALAQTTAGVTGTISDDSGGIVAGVMVTVTNVETTLQRETLSDESGFYSFPILQPGSYTMT